MSSTTEKTTHTPGPWVARGTQITAHRPHTCGGYNEESVISLVRPTEERVANLRLMASAPDLLAACERLLRSFHPITAQDSDDYKAARAAIAKAKGA